MSIGGILFLSVWLILQEFVDIVTAVAFGDNNDVDNDHVPGLTTQYFT